jgi:uncharacterized membrane protein YczE
LRIGLVRAVLEAVPLVIGFAHGEKVGVGTLAYVAAIGPIVELSFALADRTPLTT